MSHKHLLSLLLVVLLCLDAFTIVEAGWFGGSSTKAEIKKKLADAEKTVNIKRAEAKASTKKCKATVEELAEKGKKEAKKRSKTAKAEAAGFFAKKKQQFRNIFS